MLIQVAASNLADATMAEIGLAASVIQVVSTGVQVSKTLYEYVDSVKSADGQIKTIAQQIRQTTTFSPVAGPSSSWLI